MAGERILRIFGHVDIIGGETARKWEPFKGKGKMYAGRQLNEKTGKMTWVHGWNEVLRFIVYLFLYALIEIVVRP